MRRIPVHVISASILSLLAICAVIGLAFVFGEARKAEPVYPGPGVTAVRRLSEWCPALGGTAGDTDVYVLDSGVPGASMLVLGGTHPNEPAGYLSAIMLIEYCRPRCGILYVIPRANNSAFSCTDPLEAAPMTFEIETQNGKRVFRFGSRATNPVDQWPDSEEYVHASSGQILSGSETRNLNRAYPGREDGTLTEKVAFGITQLIRSEGIDITADLHEASPEYTTVNAVVAHEDAFGLALLMMWDVEENFRISLEESPKNLHGLTHRELGDYTDTMAVLMETANPSQGRLHGKIDGDLVVSGRDEYYVRAASYGAVTVPYGEEGINISERCARHITALVSMAGMYAFAGPGEELDLGDMPAYGEIIANGIGYYLHDPV